MSERIGRLFRAMECSIAGLRHALLHERAFQEEVAVLFAVVIPGAIFLGRGGIERALLIGSWLVVMAIEVLNTSLEAAVDRIGSEHHLLSGRAKDLGSAAVFISIVMAALTWCLVLCGN